MRKTAVFILPALFLPAAYLYAAQETNDPVARYNAGTKQYMKGAFGEAEKALSQSLAAAPPALQARAAYNLAGSQYKQGLGVALKNPDSARKFFEQALENYRLSIRRNFRDRDAQHNYELTQKHLELLKQKEQEQKQQQAKRQESQDQKGQGSQAQEQQAQPGQEKNGQAGKQEDAKQADAAGQQDKEQDKQEEAVSAQASEKKEGEAAKELSQEQALWILDNMQREEYGARADHTQQSVHESNVDQDW